MELGRDSDTGGQVALSYFLFNFFEMLILFIYKIDFFKKKSSF